MSPTDPASHAWWLASRASGAVAIGLLTLSVAIGLTMATKALHGRASTKLLAGIHEQVAVVALGAIGLHGVTLLGDPWLHPGVAGISVPFVMSYRPAFTGLGLISGYMAALLGLSFYFRRHFGARLWRRAHRFTVMAWVLSMTHVLGAGTDVGSWWLRALLLFAAVPVVLLAAWRAWPRTLAPLVRGL